LNKSVRKHNKELLEKAEQAAMERKQTAREVLRRMTSKEPDNIIIPMEFLTRKQTQDMRWKFLLEVRKRANELKKEKEG
jgi:hypothetical protein